MSEEPQGPTGPSILLVINPVSGVKDTDDTLQTIETFSQEMGWKLKVHKTKPKEDLRKLIRQEVDGGAQVVIAAGGDGTVADVVNGMINSGVPLGILPLGTGNNLARDLGIPVEVRKALELIAGEHNKHLLDVIQIGDRHFVLNVSIGVSAETMESTPREEKQRFGMLAYLWRAMTVLSQARQHRFLVEVDGRKFRFSATELMITNDKFMGLQPQLEGIEVDADDGRLDMFIVRANSLPEYLGVLSRFFVPADQRQEPRLKHIPIHSTARINSDESLVVQADGEVIGKTPVELRVVPDALRIIVPQAVESAETV